MNSKKNWQRIIAHVDMDAFFAAIEQRDFAELRGKPVAITNGLCGSCIITRSYEARRFGIKTGMRLLDAQKLCPALIQRASRPTVYAAVSRNILQSLEQITPDIEIFSVDEAFLELSHCRELYHSAKEVAEKIRDIVWKASNLTCSVGISGDKTTAKYASKYNKPDGITIIPPWRAEEILAPLPVTALCGVAEGVAAYLAQHGVYCCGDMKNIPVSVLARRFGSIGRRIWLMAQGKDPAPLQQNTAAPKSLGHGKIIPPNTTDEATVLLFLNHMAEKVAYRLRQHQLQAQQYQVSIRLEKRWLTLRSRTMQPISDGQKIFQIARRLLVEQWQGEGVFQCQITALDPQPADLQADLFAETNPKESQINKTMDEINHKFGQETLTNGLRMKSLEMPDVISPAWRPDGHRSTIDHTKKSSD